MSYLEETIRSFVMAAKRWNVEVFENILQKKWVLIARINSIQWCLKKYYSPKLLALKKEMCSELEVVLDNKELLWKKKSRNDWIAFEDKNTKYFHNQAPQKKVTK